MNRIEQAKQMAHEAHDSIGQKRKYTGEPYWVHTDTVAATVAEFGGTEDMVCAAHLHDVIEDVTGKNPKFDLFLIGNTFGKAVADLVVELTDVYTKEAWPDLNRNKRKALERERVSKASPEAKTIKLADFLHNTASITEHDRDFAQVYLKEKLALLPYLAEGNTELFCKVSMQTLAACNIIGVPFPVLST